MADPQDSRERSSALEPIRFYRRQEPYGEFSNFARYDILYTYLLEPERLLPTAAHFRFKTSEHFFQAMKFATTDPTYAKAILLAKTPGQAADMGRNRSRPLRPDWEEVKDDIMRLALALKFNDHQELRDLLISTGQRPIIEATTDDHYWGEGSRGDGRNMLGVILMELRDLLTGRGQPWDPRQVFSRFVEEIRTVLLTDPDESVLVG